MRTVVSYEIPSPEGDATTVDAMLPHGAQVLRVVGGWKAGIRSRLCWALVDAEAPLELRTFHLLCAGAAVSDARSARLRYVGIVSHPDIDRVEHVFEEMSPMEASISLGGRNL